MEYWPLPLSERTQPSSFTGDAPSDAPLGFVSIGFAEEKWAEREASSAQQLAQLQPETARLVLKDGAIREVRVGALRPGERLQLLAGDRVPVDGVVVEGQSAVDVSSLTGEPLPLQAEAGVELSSGSLNLEAPLVIEVTRVGADTALGIQGKPRLFLRRMALEASPAPCPQALQSSGIVLSSSRCCP